MRTFRGGVPAELIPFTLQNGEDLVYALARTAQDLNLGSAAVVMGSGVLANAHLLAAGTMGPSPVGVSTEHSGPLSIVSMQGWVLANQPEIQVVLSRGADLITGRAMPPCRVASHAEGLLLRIGNQRLARVPDAATGEVTLGVTPLPQGAPRIELLGQPIDLQAILKVPASLLSRHRVLPIAVSADTLIVATADPHDLLALDHLRLSTGMRVQFAVTPRDMLEKAIDEVTRWLQSA